MYAEYTLKIYQIPGEQDWFNPIKQDSWNFLSEFKFNARPENLKNRILISSNMQEPERQNLNYDKNQECKTLLDTYNHVCVHVCVCV